MPSTGSTPRPRKEWTNLTTATGFERCVRSTLRELYGYVALLSGRDRQDAERTVAEVYRSLFRAARAGDVESVTLGALRSAGRRWWLEQHLDELAAVDAVRSEPASVIADLSILERAVVVMQHVNGMGADRIAVELGRREDDVVAVGRHAVRRLRGTTDTSGAWLRAYLGPTVTPTGGLVDRIVRDLGAEPPAPELEPVEPDTVEVPVVGPEPDPVEEATVEVPVVGPEPEPVEPDTVEVPVVQRVDDGLADRDVPALEASPSSATDPDAPHQRSSPLRWIAPISAAVLIALALGTWAILRSGSGGEVDGDGAVDVRPTSSLADDPSTSTVAVPSTTLPSETTVPPTTEPAVVAPPTSTAAFVTGERSAWFEPACEAQIGAADPAPLSVPTGPFGPLAAEPAVSVSLPQVRSETGQLSWPAVSVVRAGDGVLVLLEAVSDISDVTDRVVAYVGLDGSLAWVRCLTDDPNVLVAPTGQVPLAIGEVADPADPDAGTTWSPIDLDDGSRGEPYEGITARAIDASLVLEGRIVLTEPVVTWQFDDGRWVLTGLDTDGSVLWTDPAAEAPFGDSPAFVIRAADGTALVATCAERPAADVENCSEAGPLVAYDAATGEVRWTIDGDLAPVAADGHALVRSADGWDLIDMTDGTPIDGQHWDDSSTFEQSAGLDGESVFVDLVDGVLVAAHGDRLDLWLPRAFDAPSAEVSFG